MSDPNKPPLAQAAPQPGPLPGTALIQEMLDNARGGNRTVLPPRLVVPTQTGNGIPAPSSPFNSQASPEFIAPRPGQVIPGSVPGGVSLPALPAPSGSASGRPNYIPPAVIPPSRGLPELPQVSVDTPVAIANKVPFPFSPVTNKVETASGTLGFTATNALADKVIGLQPLSKQAIPFLTKLKLGIPAGVIGTEIAQGGALGSGEERDVALRIAAVNFGRELAGRNVVGLSPAEIGDVNTQFTSQPRVAAGLIQGFNEAAAANARVLAAGLAVDAARGLAGGDLLGAAGAKAILRREAFVAGLLGLILPNSELGPEGINPPQPWRGDP